MLPKNNEKGDSSNLIDEKSKELQVETRGDSQKEPSPIIGLYFLSLSLHQSSFEIENIPSQAKLLAWCSYDNKISIVEIETQQEFANFDGVKLNNSVSILQPFISDSIRSQYIKISAAILT